MIIPKKKTILNYVFFDIIIGTFEILIPAESTNSFFLKLISSESHRLIEKSKIKCWRRRKLPKLPQIKKTVFRIRIILMRIRIRIRGSASVMMDPDPDSDTDPDPR